MKKIVWHNAAKKDFLDTVNYIKDSFGTVVASECLSDIQKTINLLSRFPYLGKAEPDLNYKGFRIYALHSKMNRILYVVNENDVLIIAIWNNRMNFENIHKILKDR